MQRLALTISSFVIIVVMIINVGLFYQNTQLRARVAAPQPTQVVVPGQAERIAALEQELKRSEQDRIKATRDAAAARSQFDQLSAAARRRDTLKPPATGATARERPAARAGWQLADDEHDQ
ncbi:MAG: hypothetical protein U0Z44_21075 [Kouleothrix sp.]